MSDDQSWNYYSNTGSTDDQYYYGGIETTETTETTASTNYTLLSAPPNEIGMDDQAYTREYWKLDEKVYGIFYEIDPSHDGMSVSLSDFDQICQRLDIKVDENRRHEILDTLDTTNDLIILKHDFVNFVLKEWIQTKEEILRKNRKPLQVPVAFPTWEEIMDHNNTTTTTHSSMVVYYYNIHTRETKWELPSLILKIRQRLGINDPKNGFFTLEYLLTNEKEQEQNCIQKLRNLFSQFDEDQDGKFDENEFEDFCVAIGQNLPSSRSMRVEMMKEIDPFTAFAYGASITSMYITWDAFYYYFLTNAPFQKRIFLLANSFVNNEWQQIEELTTQEDKFYFINAQTNITRWNHPEMDQRIFHLIHQIFPSTKIVLEKKIELFYQQQLLLQTVNNKNTNSKIMLEEEGFSTNTPISRVWRVEHFKRVLDQLGQFMSTRKQCLVAMEIVFIQYPTSIFFAGTSSNSSSSSNRTNEFHGILYLDQVIKWFQTSIKRFEKDGWEEMANDKGDIYYLHELTGKTQWEPPELQKEMQNMMDKFGIGLKIEEKIERLFKIYDVDESGCIGQEELIRLCHALGYKMSMEQIEKLMKLLDTTGDGTISLEEFQIWFKTKLKIEKKETEEEKNQQLENKRKENCIDFLEKNGVLEYVVDLDQKTQEKKKIAFDSMLLGRLVHLLGYQIRGKDLQNALRKLVQTKNHQLILLEDFLNWFKDFQVLEQAKEMAAKAAKEAAEKVEKEKQQAFASSSKGSSSSLKRRGQATTFLQQVQIREMFHQYDVDRSGTLEKNELKLLTKALGHELDPKQLDQMMSAIDISGDGQVSCDEFVHFWTTFQRQRRGVQPLIKANAVFAFLSPEAREKVDAELGKTLRTDEVQNIIQTFQENHLTTPRSKKKKQKRTSMFLETAKQLKEVHRRVSSTSEATSIATLGLGSLKDQTKKLSVEENKNVIHDFKDDIQAKVANVTVIKEENVPKISAPVTMKRPRYTMFVPTCKRKYAHLDVTWIEPEVVSCMKDMIERVVENVPLYFAPQDAAQQIQKILRRRLAKNRILRMLDRRFQPQVDWKTHHLYYVDTITGKVNLNRPIYKTQISAIGSVSEQEEKNQNEDKILKAKFQRKRNQMIQKKSLYDKYNFGKPFVDPKKRPLYVPSAFFMYEVMSTVKQRLLGHDNIQLVPKQAPVRGRTRRNAAIGITKQHLAGGGGIWFALRNRELILTQLIAQKYRRQLKERSSEASKYLPLHYATRSKDFPVEVIKAIVSGYEDGRFEVDAYGMTPLHLAIRERRGQKVVKLLLKPEICRMKSNTGETPLHLAIMHRADNKIIQILLQADGNNHIPLKTLSSTAIYSTRQEATMSIPAKKMLNEHGVSPFHLSVKKFDGSENSKKRIELFLDSDESGVSNEKNDAATEKNAALINASPRIVTCSRTWTFHGELPLHLALENGLCQQYTSFSTAGGFWLVKLLLKKFPDAILLPKRRNQLLPLHLAIKRALPSEIVMELLEATANASDGFSLDTSSSSLLRTSNQMTLLHYAMICRAPDDTIISLCIKSPKEILTEKNDKGDLPLHLAAYLYENTEIIKLMIEREPSGAVIRNNKGQLPLHLAVEGNNRNNVQFLLQMCPWTLFKQDGRERDVLILACRSKWPDDEMLEFLMDAPSFQGKRWEYQSQKHVTPFYAISTGKSTDKIIEKHIPTQLLKLAHTTEEDMLHLARKTLRRKRYCPTTKWDFPQILEVIERNPSNEAVIQRAVLAINQKLEQIASAKSKDENIPPIERKEWILNHIALNKELGLVRALHYVLYEFPHNTRIQILGTACMRRLLPNAYSKAKYQSIVDPYFNLQVAPPNSKSRSAR